MLNNAKMIKPAFNIINQSGNTAEIRIYDYIYEYGEGSSRNISNQINNLSDKVEFIVIRVNSGGGSVMEGVAIYNILKSTKAHVTIIVDGVAASAMSFICMGADTVKMGKATRMMLHKLSGSGSGSAKDLRSTADMMDSWEEDIIDLYAARTGMTKKQLKNKFFKEGVNTWLSPQQALDLGLIDEIVDGVVIDEPSNTVKGAENMYQHYHAQIKNTINTNIKMDKAALEALGLKEGASNEEVVNAINNLKKPATPVVPKATSEPTENNEEVVNLRKKLATELIDNAVLGGKIVASERDNWVEMAITNYDNAKAAVSKLSAVKPSDMIKNGGNGSDDRSEWTIANYLENGEGDALEALKESDPEKYRKLYNAEYSA